jgi:hypothetical protein
LGFMIALACILILGFIRSMACIQCLGFKIILAFIGSIDFIDVSDHSASSKLNCRSFA